MFAPMPTRPTEEVTPDFDVALTLLPSTTCNIYLRMVDDEYIKDLLCTNEDGTEFFATFMGPSEDWWIAGSYKLTIIPGASGVVNLACKGVGEFKFGDVVNETNSSIYAINITTGRHLERIHLKNMSELVTLTTCDLDLCDYVYVRYCNKVNVVNIGALPIVEEFEIKNGVNITVGDMAIIENMRNAFSQNYDLTDLTIGHLPNLTDARNFVTNCSYLVNFTATGVMSSAVADGTADYSEFMYDCISLVDPVSAADINFKAITKVLSFYDGCRALTTVPAYDFSEVTVMTYFCYKAIALVNLPSNINTGKCVNFDLSWYKCTALTSFPTIDITAATSLRKTWANCSGLTSFPMVSFPNCTTLISTWVLTGLTSFPLVDTSHVTLFSRTWKDSQLATFPVIDTSSATTVDGAWDSCKFVDQFPVLDFSNVTTARDIWAYNSLMTVNTNVFPSATIGAGLFKQCPALLPSFNMAALFPTSPLDISYLFYGCSLITDVDALVCSASKNFRGSFESCDLLSASLLTPDAEDVRSMFSSNPRLHTVTGVTTDKCIYMSSMFYNCRALRNLPVLDTSVAVHIGSLLYNCRSLVELPTLNLPLAQYANNMFFECYRIDDTPPISFPVGRNVSGLYQGCKSMRTSGTVNAPVATDVTGMFSGCDALVNCGALTTSATDARSMFAYCYSMKTMPTWFAGHATLVKWDFAFTSSGIENIDSASLINATNLKYCFYDCKSLRIIPDLVLPNVTEISNMFKDASGITHIGTFSGASVAYMTDMVRDCYNLYSMGAMTLPALQSLPSFVGGCKALHTAPDMVDLSSCTYISNPFSSGGVEVIRHMDFTNSPSISSISNTSTNPTNAVITASSAATTGGTYTNSNPRLFADMNTVKAIHIKPVSSAGAGGKYEFKVTAHTGEMGKAIVKVEGQADVIYNITTTDQVIEVNGQGYSNDHYIYFSGIRDVKKGVVTNNIIDYLKIYKESSVSNYIGTFDGMAIRSVYLFGVYDDCTDMIANQSVNVVTVQTSYFHCIDITNMCKNTDLSGGAAYGIHLSSYTKIADHAYENSELDMNIVVNRGCSLESGVAMFKNNDLTEAVKLGPIHTDCTSMYEGNALLVTHNPKTFARPTIADNMFKNCPLATDLNYLDGKYMTSHTDWMFGTTALVRPTSAEQTVVEGGGLFDEAEA